MDACDSTLLKICTKCGITKPTGDFHKDKQRSDGLRPSCKSCKKAAGAEYWAKNSEKGRAYALAWAAANPEKKRAAKQAWRALNRDKMKAESAAYRLANPEKLVAAEARRYRSNPEKEKARVAAYRAKNPGKGKLHVQNRRAKIKGNGGKLSKGLPEKLFDLQKGKCPCCKKPLGTGYHLDHKMPLALGGTNTDENIQLLRASCNLQKKAKHPVDFMQSRGFLL